jgi:YidC/Oxa1 family membrane protein insertase
MSMELRMLLAIVLSFLIFFLYQVLFVKEMPVQPKEPPKKEAESDTQAPAGAERVKVLEERPPVKQADVAQEQVPGRTITISTPLYVAELTEPGGAFKTFKLRNYKESLEANAPMQELVQLPSGQASTPVVSFLGTGLGSLGHPVFRATSNVNRIDVSEAKKDVSFTWTSRDGVTIIKTYSFFPDTYGMGLKINVRNLGLKPIEDNLTVSLRTNLKNAQNSRYVFSGPAALIDGELKEIKTKKIASEGSSYAGRITWVAGEDQYFVSAIIPEEAQKANMRLSLTPKDVLETTYVDPSPPVAPATERTYQYKLYFGPKSLQALGREGSELGKILNFGFFDIIAKPLLHAMNFIHRYIPSYGIAIILITIIVKLLFWPLSNKSYQSMSQMKRLQPKMAEIRAKYKHDKKMMNQELMALYKVYKVNPLGGCLPMILQIPVFFAFYKMLYQAIELRHAPFFLWINDLSAPDRLFRFSFKIPMMAPPYGIPVLTIIMGASMFFQQKMSPPPGDPAQAKMMMFMPIFFTFIFINFPSGLVLYWLVNNILSMAQQYYITKKMA